MIEVLGVLTAIAAAVAGPVTFFGVLGGQTTAFGRKAVLGYSLHALIGAISLVLLRVGR
jgi:ABC-type enterochelin transport system permease subunit